MTFANKKSGLVLSIVALCAVVAFGAGFVVPSVVHAEGWGEDIGDGGGWGGDIGDGGGWGGDIYGDGGWGGDISGDGGWGGDISGDGGWGDDISGDGGWGGDISGDGGWGDDIFGSDEWGSDISGYDDTPEYGCDEGCDSNGGGSDCNSCGGGNGGFGGSSIRGGSSGGMTIMPPRYAQPPVYYPPTYYPPQQPPHYTTSNNTNITTNTCTNGSCNNTSTVTNVNQNPTPYYPVVYQQQPAPYCTITIANYGYGNATLTWSAQNATSAYISGIGQVATYGSRQVYTNGTVYTMTVSGQGGSASCQTQSVYYPTPVPTPIPVANAYCQITASPSVIQNGQTAYLSWTSTGGYATISDGIGQVAANGSLAVRPEASRNYVLTVYGNGGTRTCNAVVTVKGTYVSLTQIPYTGFDFGIVGNAIYWMSLLAFAASLAYLALYFMPRNAGNGLALAFAQAGQAGNRFKVQMPQMKTIKVPQAVFHAPAISPVKKDVIVTPAKSLHSNDRPAQDALRIIAKPAQIELKEFKTNDKMKLVQSTEGSAPRLVITRA